MVPGNGTKVWINTFHSFCAKFLRRHAKELKLNPDFSIYGETEQKKLINLVLKELGLEKEKGKAALYLSVISRAKDDLMDAGSFKIHAMASNTDYRITAANIYTLYQEKLVGSGALDFGDLLLKTAAALKENKSIRDYYQNYFEYILVDEYQDTNHAQYMITKTLAAKHKNLSVVGDPDQSIYSWRGADIRNILEFEHDFPNANIVTLEQNYRSTPNILKSADNVIQNNINRKPKKLTAVKSAGE
jgi:DNA helicase-2/ATP-dependent DNA helicase PcrA